MAIYYAFSEAMPLTDPDGAKRGKADIVISDHDVSHPIRGRLRIVDLFINEKKITITISDGSNGKDISVSASIRSE